MKHLLLGLGLLAGLAPATAPAQGLAINLRAGTQGIAGGITKSLGRHFNARVDVPWFTYNHSATQEIDDFTMDYDAEASLLAVGAVVDWYPWANAFRLSGGAYANQSEVTILGRSAESYTVGSVTYSPEDIGEITGTVSTKNQVAPYVGVGLGNPVAANNRIGVTLDLGAMYIGGPKVAIAGTKMLEPMSEQAPVIEGNVQWAKWYPVLALGLSVKLF